MAALSERTCSSVMSSLKSRYLFRPSPFGNLYIITRGSTRLTLYRSVNSFILSRVLPFWHRVVTEKSKQIDNKTAPLELL